MPFELPVDPRQERRAPITRWLGTAFGVLLVVLVLYFGYVGYEGSRQLTNADTDSTDCRTPSTLGWLYEAINYPIGSDALLAEQPDQAACTSRGARPGGEIVGPGGVRLAGWYIPATAEIGPTGTTVILAHGWSSNKSDMLSRATMLHDRYNLVLFDFRNHGQSEPGDTTQGVREAGDLRAVVDWLVEHKAPERVAVLGVSMGGASAVTEAAGDDRIAAIILESTHASLANAVQARLEQSGYPLAVPGSWATLLGALIRTGEDVSSADPPRGHAAERATRAHHRRGPGSEHRTAECRGDPSGCRGGRFACRAGGLRGRRACRGAGGVRRAIRGLGARLPRARPRPRRLRAPYLQGQHEVPTRR